MEFKKITFKNGLRVLLIPKSTSKSITISLLVRTGSKFETKEINGISHFLEHMFFKGTKKRPSSFLVAETLDKIGGIYNAFTSKEHTGYWVKVPSNYFDLATDWISDIFFNSTFKNENIEKEKKVIIEEINMVFDNPMDHIYDLWDELLYQDQPAGWNIAGTKETVMGITKEKILSYFNSHYIASNSLIVVSGKFKEELIIKTIKKYFEKIKIGQAQKNTPVIEKQIKPEVLLEPRKIEQTHLILGFRGFNIFHPRRYHQEILANILGGMMSSRMFEKIRTKLGLAYHIHTFSSSNPDTGSLATYAGIKNEKIKQGLKAILNEYKKISEKKISEKELKKAKENIKGKQTLLLEAPEMLAAFYGEEELFENHIFTLKEIFNKIDKTTVSDILKTAKEIFQPRKLNLALVGPFKDKNIFEKLLYEF